MFIVFVSSTSDFFDERRRLEDYSGFRGSIYFDNYDHHTISPGVSIYGDLISRIVECDLLVALVGHRYGSDCSLPIGRHLKQQIARAGTPITRAGRCPVLPPGPNRSVVQWEIETAWHAHGKIRIFKRRLPDEPEPEDKQRPFIAQLARSAVDAEKLPVDEYTSLDDFVTIVNRILLALLSQLKKEKKEEHNQDQKFRQFATTAALIAMLICLGLPIAVVGGLIHVPMLDALKAILCLTPVIIVGCILVMRPGGPQ